MVVGIGKVLTKISDLQEINILFDISEVILLSDCVLPAYYLIDYVCHVVSGTL
jgi:hypothetical protein